MKPLAALLHYANSDPGWSRGQFYVLKDRLLRRYATFRGHEIQEITKECWGERKWDWDAGEYVYFGCGPTCRHCGGTGVFDRRWVRLERWVWGKYVFHIPSGDTRIKPERVDIIGRIEHRNYGRGAREARLWLYLLTGEFALLRREIGVISCGVYCWPLLNLVRLVSMVVRLVSMVVRRVGRRKCFCGRKFFHCGSGWQICFRCRNQPRDMEVPF